MKYCKILILFLLIFCFGCVQGQPDANPDNENMVALPNLEGMSREQIANKLDKLGLKYTFITESKKYHSDNELDKFIKYGKNFEKYDRVEVGSHLYIYTTALPLPKEDIVDVDMDFEYYGKTFIDDGYEEVTLVRSVDGDTAHFYTQDNTYIKVRFLGVDTPESTIEKEAWGKAAANFTKEILENAYKIVIEAEGNTQDTYGRYLAFVWYKETEQSEFKLLNLEIIKNAYSNSKISSKSKYYDAFFDTEVEIMKTGRRVWGEIDPNYDYDRKEFK